MVAHEQICNCQRLFVVYGEFLGKTKCSRTVENVIVTVLCLYSNILVKMSYKSVVIHFKKIIMQMINSKSFLSI